MVFMRVEIINKFFRDRGKEINIPSHKVIIPRKGKGSYNRKKIKKTFKKHLTIIELVYNCDL